MTAILKWNKIRTALEPGAVGRRGLNPEVVLRGIRRVCQRPLCIRKICRDRHTRANALFGWWSKSECTRLRGPLGGVSRASQASRPRASPGTRLQREAERPGLIRPAPDQPRNGASCRVEVTGSPGVAPGRTPAFKPDSNAHKRGPSARRAGD